MRALSLENRNEVSKPTSLSKVKAKKLITKRLDELDDDDCFVVIHDESLNTFAEILVVDSASLLVVLSNTISLLAELFAYVIVNWLGWLLDECGGRRANCFNG